jgi:hypothetical protein
MSWTSHRGLATLLAEIPFIFGSNDIDQFPISWIKAKEKIRLIERAPYRLSSNCSNKTSMKLICPSKIACTASGKRLVTP